MGPESKPFSRRVISLPGAALVPVGRSMHRQMKSCGNAFFDSCVISREHGTFKYHLGRFYFTDTSRNGTFLNNVRLEHGVDARLNEGDNIQFGEDQVQGSQLPDKIIAVLRLTYPHVYDTMVPSSLQAVDGELDKTGSWENLCFSLESIKNRTPFEEEKLRKVKIAMRMSKDLGLTHKEAVEKVGL